MSELCLFSIIILVFVVLPVKTLMDYFHHKSLPDLWDKFACANGFTLIPGKFSVFSYNWPVPPAVTGTYRNFNYILSLKETYDGEYRSTFTFINIDLPVNIKSNFSIYKKNFLYKLIGMKECKEISSGDLEFDKVFTIHSEIRENINKILTPELRQKMLYDRDIINISLEGQILHYKTSGILRDINILQNITEIMGELAANIFALKSDFSKEIPVLLDREENQKEWICSSCNIPVSINSIYCINCGQKR